MYPAIVQWIPKPWLCSLQGITYVDHNKDSSNLLSDRMSTSHSLIIVTCGKGTLDWSNRATHLEKGKIIFVPAAASIVVASSIETKDKLQLYKLDLAVAKGEESSVNTKETESLESFSLIELNYTPWSSCLEIVDQLLRQQKTRTWLEEWDVQLRFQDWFRILLQQNDPGVEDRDDRARIQRSIRYIREHYDQAITVDDLAADIGLTRANYPPIQRNDRPASA